MHTISTGGEPYSGLLSCARDSTLRRWKLTGLPTKELKPLKPLNNATHVAFLNPQQCVFVEANSLRTCDASNGMMLGYSPLGLGEVHIVTLSFSLSLTRTHSLAPL